MHLLILVNYLVVFILSFALPYIYLINLYVIYLKVLIALYLLLTLLDLFYLPQILTLILILDFIFKVEKAHFFINTAINKNKIINIDGYLKYK